MKEKSFEPGCDNVVLIGMPGAGKSTLGIVLAKILCRDFVDADLLIQQSCDKSLQRLIDTLGPDAFIEIENQVLSEMSFEHSVIATGGSAVYSDAAMEHLGKIGRVVYLKISFDGALGRLLRSRRCHEGRYRHEPARPVRRAPAPLREVRRHHRRRERPVHYRRRPQSSCRAEVASLVPRLVAAERCGGGDGGRIRTASRPVPPGYPGGIFLDEKIHI